MTNQIEVKEHYSMNPEEPTLIYSVKFRDGRMLWFTIYKTMRIETLSFLDTLENAPIGYEIYALENWLNKKGFKENR